MQRKPYCRVIVWGAVAAWMAVIFLFSAQNDNQSGDTSGVVVRWFLSLIYPGFREFPALRQQELLEAWHTLIRKGAHFSEYAVLAALIANGLRASGKLRWWLPIALSALYAVSDEIHQYFVPGRACRLLDMGIDTCGAAFGTAVFALILWLLRRNIQSKTKTAQ